MQVIGLAPGVGKTLLEEVVERCHLLQAPVLSRANFAEITAQIHEAQIPFVETCFVPSKDLVDLAEDKYRTFEIELGRHRGPAANPQARQARQGCSLPVQG